MPGRDFSIFLIVLTLYFLAEACLRQGIYAIPNDRAEAKVELLSYLPAFMKGYYERKFELEELEKELEATKEPDARFKLLVSLSSKHDPGDAKSFQEQMITEFKTSFRIASHYVRYLKENREIEKALEAYFSYLDNCELKSYRQKVKIWEAGLQLVRDQPLAIRKAYYEGLLKNRLVAPEFSNAYRELWEMSLKSGNNAQLKACEELQKICHELFLAKQMKKK